MIKWLLENVEWVFSGIGVTVLLAILSIIFKKKPNHRIKNKDGVVVVGSHNSISVSNGTNSQESSQTEELIKIIELKRGEVNKNINNGIEGIRKRMTDYPSWIPDPEKKHFEKIPDRGFFPYWHVIHEGYLFKEEFNNLVDKKISALSANQFVLANEITSKIHLMAYNFAKDEEKFKEARDDAARCCVGAMMSADCSYKVARFLRGIISPYTEAVIPSEANKSIQPNANASAD